MDIDQDILTGQAVVYVLAFSFNALLLYFSVFGKRMAWRASRWHVINVSAWNIVATVFYASYGDRTPWTDYMHNVDIADYFVYIKQFCFTTFHNGMIFVFIETLIVFFIPSLGNSFFFSMIWCVLICVVSNLLMLFCFLARLIWGDDAVGGEMFWYDPIAFYQVVVVCIFGIMIVVYLIAAIAASVLSCIIRFRIRHRWHNYWDLWGTWLYGLIPFPFFCLTTGFSMVQFLQAKMPDFYAWGQATLIGFFTPKPGVPDPTAIPDPTAVPTTANPMEMMLLIGKLLALFLDLITWTEASIPLLEAICAMVFLVSYLQQFIFCISAGEFLQGPRTFNEVKGRAPLQMNAYPNGMMQTQMIGPVGQKTPVTTVAVTAASRTPMQAFVNPPATNPSPPPNYNSAPPSTVEIVQNQSPVIVLSSTKMYGGYKEGIFS